MSVSVIIPTRNTAKLTAETLRSLQRGDGSEALEIIVVDNGSTDDTASALPRDFPQIKLVAAGRNLGFARACNLAARDASGEFLLLLNSDAQPEPDAIASAAAWLRANPDCAAVGGQLLHEGGKRQNSIANFPTLATELLNKSLLRRLWPKKFPGKEQAFETPVEVETVIGAFMLIRKPVWDSLGGLDERFFFFLEETDFCLRARRNNLRVMHLPQVRVRHGQGQTARQVSAAARIEYWRSRYAYFAKHFGMGVRIMLRAGLLARLFVDWLAAMLMTGLTLGRSARWRSRLNVCSALAAWHLRGLPASAGLPR